MSTISYLYVKEISLWALCIEDRDGVCGHFHALFRQTEKGSSFKDFSFNEFFEKAEEETAVWKTNFIAKFGEAYFNLKYGKDEPLA